MWFHLYPYENTPVHVVDGLTSLDTTFGINVPPFTQLIRRGRYVNTRGAPMNMLHVSGHMHKRGLRFSAWQSDGTKLFDEYDWSHPTGRYLVHLRVPAPRIGLEYYEL